MEGIMARKFNRYKEDGYIPVWFKPTGEKEYYLNTNYFNESDVDSYRKDLWVSIGPKCLIQW